MALSSGIVPEYVKILVRSTECTSTTSHIVTARDLRKDIVSFRRDFARQLETINPDIVHFHACWDFKSAVAEQLARSKGYFTVVSPHGGLSPENMEQKFWTERLPRIILYQLRMVRKCCALIVTTENEKKDMEHLRWKHNIALIPHPLTNEMSDDETASLLLSTYRKVIDTNYRKRLTAEEEMIMNTCLRASVWQDEISSEDESFMIPDINENDISFRRLYIYAHDQEVTDMFINGAHRLGVKIPPRLDVAGIPRYKVKTKKDNKATKNLNKLSEILSELTRTKSQDISVVNLRTLLHVYCLLRFNDYDEDNFAKLVAKHNIETFTRKLLNQLSEIFQLELGFMPILPK